MVLYDILSLRLPRSFLSKARFEVGEYCLESEILVCEVAVFIKRCSLYSVLTNRMLCIFLHDYNMRLEGMKLKKYLGYFFFNAFLKWHSLLHQCRTRRNSKPISWYFLSFGVPVKVRHTLYWDFHGGTY